MLLKQTTLSKMGGRPKHFSKEDLQMAKSHMKRCSTPVNFREIQIKTKMRYYLTPIKMSVIKKNPQTINEYSEKGPILHCWWECKLVQPL